MPTLSKTTEKTKLILKWGGISLIIFFLSLIVLKFITIIKDSLTPPPPPQASFGKLPPISFPNQSKRNITYSIDTISGVLPNFSDRAKVYRINIAKPTFLALDEASEKVAKVGFASIGTLITEDVYQWVDQNIPQRRITMNIFSQDFTLTSPYLITPSLETLNNFSERENAIKLAESFLSSMSLLPNDIDMEKTKSNLYSIEQSTLNPTSDISNAKIVKVDFFQKNLDDIPIYYEKGLASTLNFLIGRQNNQLKVFEAHFFYKNVSENSSTYAIKSASEAYEDLKSGKAYIASIPQDTVEVNIRKILLGYYMGEGQQDFLMPVIVFEGDNDFIAYVSAVKDEWIGN